MPVNHLPFHGAGDICIAAADSWAVGGPSRPYGALSNIAVNLGPPVGDVGRAFVAPAEVAAARRRRRERSGVRRRVQWPRRRRAHDASPQRRRERDARFSGLCFRSAQIERDSRTTFSFREAHCVTRAKMSRRARRGALGWRSVGRAPSVVPCDGNEAGVVTQRSTKVRVLRVRLKCSYLLTLQACSPYLSSKHRNHFFFFYFCSFYITPPDSFFIAWPLRFLTYFILLFFFRATFIGVRRLR